MATTTIYADRIQIIDPNAPNLAGTAESITGASKQLALLHFTAPAAMKNKSITQMELFLYVENSYTSAASWLFENFGSSVTYNTRPRASTATRNTASQAAAAYKGTTLIASYVSFPPYNVFEFGIQLKPITSSALAVLSTSLTANPPYLVVTYNNTDNYGKVTGTPSSGYTPKYEAATFRWSYTAPDNTAEKPTVTSSRFAYRKTASGSFTFVNAGSALSYTAPAGTFADTDTVYWYPEVTLSNGQVIRPTNTLGTAITYQLSTVEPAFTAVAVSPDGTIEDGSGPITFTWTASNSVGSTPSGAELQYSVDGGTTWTALGSVTGSALSYEAPAGTVPGGQISWRVRALNSAGTPGEWSNSLSFISVAAPAAPSVSTDAAPFTTITWNAVGQQAYEVLVDGKSYGVRFGTGKNFTLPQPLADGNHTAAVRIQGAYGLWSQPGEAVFTVQNVPAGSIELSGQFGIDAELFWSASPSGEDFLIYRDGVQIGHTAGTAFTDRRALGTHEWTVLLRQEDGNYTRSNAVTGTTAVEGTMIAPLSGGPWVSLRRTEASVPARQYNFSRTHSLRHFSGSALPVLELTPYENKTGSFQCAFKDPAEARAFEALWGQVVVVKSQENVITGGLMNLDKAQNAFYTAYAFTIEQIALEEVVDG